MTDTSQYEIKIEGMHCNACAILITDELTENGLNEVNVDLENNNAIFKGPKGLHTIESILNKAFKNLKTYQVKEIKYFNELESV